MGVTDGIQIHDPNTQFGFSVREEAFAFGVHSMRTRRRRSLNRRRQTRKRELHVEVLCDRVVLDGSGLGVTDPLPWFDPGALTYSFAPDGTDVAGYQSQLFSEFDALGDSASWQAQFDAAFNAWLAPLNATIRNVEDSGSVFGIGGQTQGDDRFGDIRIAAIPLSQHVLATSIPHSAMIQGTWAGDILINADAEWHDLQEVFAVALHEFGHVLGLPHSQDPASPMFIHGVHDAVAPTSGDIRLLQNLYAGIDFEDHHDGSHDQDVAEAEPAEAEPVAADPATPSDDSVGANSAANFDLSQAISLLPSIGSTIRYAAKATVSDSATPMVYRLDPTAQQAEDLENLHVTWRSSGVVPMDADVTIIDAQGHVVESRVLHHGQGSVIVQALGVDSESINYVVVTPLGLVDSQLVGEFEMIVDYGSELRLPHEIGEIQLDADHPVLEQTFSVSSSRLVHLHVETPRELNSDAFVQVMLLDSNENVLTEILLDAGTSRSAPLTFLSAGDYTIRYVANQKANAPLREIRLTVFIDEASIDVGPGISNPTGTPYLPCGALDAIPGYCYVYVPIIPGRPTAPEPPTVPGALPNPVVTVPEPPVTTTPKPGASSPAKTNPKTPADPGPTDSVTSGTQPSPWQNQLNRYDVTGNASITAHDALVVINILGRRSGEIVKVTDTPTDFFADVNGDYVVSAADALMVINSLAMARAAETEFASLVAPGALSPSNPSNNTRREQTTDSAIVLLF